MIRIGALINIVVLVVLVAFVARPDWFSFMLEPLTKPGQAAIYTQNSLFNLVLSHLGLVFAATVAGAILAVGLAILVTRPFGREFLPLSRTLANAGQTFPPVAVLALAVPMLGFGAAPTLLALFLYGLLPIFENALTGIEGVPANVQEAALGAGMTEGQKLMRVELPLALPAILSGIRISAVISMGTATIGSTVAASTLGETIIAGLINSNIAFVAQGAIVVGLLAIIINDVMQMAERRAARYRRVAR